MNTQELLSKLELVEVQARVTLALVQDIRRMLSVEANPETTLEIPVLDGSRRNARPQGGLKRIA